MPVLSVNYHDPEGKVPPDGLLLSVGPSIRVIVGPAPPAEENGSLKLQGDQVAALIDTGASTSCIDEKMAERLSLTPIDRQKLHGVGGEKEHLVYLGIIFVPDLGTHSKGRFVGVDLGETQPVLLGRDFLRGCVFIYSGGTGTITVCR